VSEAPRKLRDALARRDESHEDPEGRDAQERNVSPQNPVAASQSPVSGTVWPMTADQVTACIEAERQNRPSPRPQGYRVDWNDPDPAMIGVDLSGRILRGLDLNTVRLAHANLERADLRETNLDNANLYNANLRDALLTRASLQGTSLVWAQLEGADLGQVILNTSTKLANVVLYSDRPPPNTCGAVVAGIRWTDANLLVVDWDAVPQLGDDEFIECRQTATDGTPITKEWRGHFARQAVSANLQLGIALQEQGLHADADRFFHRSHELRRKYLLGWRTGQRRSLLFSWVSWALADYGYSLGRCIAWYFGVVFFAVAYFFRGQSLSEVGSAFADRNYPGGFD
jgi:hypothetical protein